ncbi:hypothetical protein VIOR3934_13162 [Vibrio orientalis CIP 102891 = ATCC 33934]|uniref:Uncharacterized protein n=1 Tax=Vibrio orientalis CIP 102891 = ATCC 33934 TaxID=675816 RepID=F9SY73_VIBOR|nr:hypothetical protein VIOR3934_13162 [Vibrio orientalis CIP 102891 = ATCC 33934]
MVQNLTRLCPEPSQLALRNSKVPQNELRLIGNRLVDLRLWDTSANGGKRRNLILCVLALQRAIDQNQSELQRSYFGVLELIQAKKDLTLLFSLYREPTDGFKD